MDVAIEAVRQIEKSLMCSGVVAILFGILIFIYPALLGMLVGVFLMLLDLMSIIFAVRIKKYSKIKI